jgi:Cytochrome c554 and c-prime
MKAVLILLLIATSLPRTAAQEPATAASQMSTEDRLQKPGWWPTKGAAARSDYVGARVCAQCHASVFATQKTTSMAEAAVLPPSSSILNSHRLNQRSDPYQYTITSRGELRTYSVSDGRHTISLPLSLAAGTGSTAGQSYLFELEGNYYEARLSYFRTLHEFDITPGHSRSTPPTLEQAAGRRLSAAETHKCFGCHTTASMTEYKFDPSQATPGVTCEACHGPGANHAGAMRAGIEGGEGLIMNPRRLNPSESVDFCGACHRTWWDGSMSGITGPLTLRFAPYRLENSRCWGKGDARLSCVACHDPHVPLVRDETSYDTKCLACHVTGSAKTTGDHPAAACRVSTKNCVSCHMPKYEVPGTHSEFIDHWIRIVRKGEAFPN